MSYILEALRKADAERERGTVPDLQSQWLPGSPSEDEPEPRSAARWLWPMLGLGAVLLGLAGWWYVRSNATTTVAPVAGPPAMPASSVAVSSAASAASVPVSAPASAAVSAPAEQPPPAPVKKSVAPRNPAKAEAARARREAAAAAKARKQAEADAAARDKREAATKAAAVAAPPSAPAMLMLRLNELPEDLRRQVPALTVGGSIYSPQADKRMVIFNGQVFAEGALLTPELKLEQIRPKSAVLSIRGQRFEIPF